jgi:hypothetical protein
MTKLALLQLSIKPRNDSLGIINRPLAQPVTTI